MLEKATDWELSVDLKKQLVFPQDIVATRLRPDIVMVSRSEKLIFIAELTVPWEDHIDLSHERKSSKYQDLIDDMKSKGWHVEYHSIEVRCRGFPATSLRRMCKDIGIQGSRLKGTCIAIGAVAEEASRWLWLKRKDDWQPSASEA